MKGHYHQLIDVVESFLIEKQYPISLRKNNLFKMYDHDWSIPTVTGSQLRVWCAVISHSQIKYHYCQSVIFHLIY